MNVRDGDSFTDEIGQRYECLRCSGATDLLHVCLPYPDLSPYAHACAADASMMYHGRWAAQA